MSKRKTKEEFISEAKLIHGDKYNYDKVIYKTNKTKIKIVCPIHGCFYQVPSSHLRGCGCDKCGGTFNMNTKTFINKSKSVHGDKFTYDKVNYIGCFDKVIIGCKIHGDFLQKPSSHLMGYGCIKCSNTEKYDNEKFIKLSKKIHGDKFLYNNLNYINNDTKIMITCKEHGDFPQNPKNHLNGFGCPSCSKSNGESKISDFLKNNNLKFQPQFSFSDLRHKRSLFFDFAVFNDNQLICLIEYNGEQHYKYVSFMHQNEEGFELQKKKDKLKEDYCLKNNIPLYIKIY